MDPTPVLVTFLKNALQPIDVFLLVRWWPGLVVAGLSRSV